MATTVAQLQVEVNALREQLAVLSAEVTTLREARPAPKRVSPEGTTQVFPSPKEALAACKEGVMHDKRNRYCVVGNVLHVVAR